MLSTITTPNKPSAATIAIITTSGSDRIPDPI
jgi:hypothetical protein